MLLFDALTGRSWWLVALLLFVCATGLAALAPFLVRRTVGFERLVVNNEVAGFQYTMLGTSYAVLLALALVAVWGDFRDAQRGVQTEATAWVNLYLLATAMPEPGRDPVHAALRDYASALVDDEWPAMAEHKEGDLAGPGLNSVRAAILALQVRDARETVLFHHMLERLEELSHGRRERLDMVRGSLPALVQTVLVAGAILTVGFTLFFAGRCVVSQALMTGMLCLMIMLVLFAVIELDYPFAGDTAIGPEPLVEMMDKVRAL